MARRLLLPLVAVLVLGLAACGDNEDNAGGGGGGDQTAAQTTPGTTGPNGEATRGCRDVEEPKPKKAKVGKPKDRLDPKKTWVAVMKTSCGTLEITLDAKANPKTAASFAHLAREGFYDGLPFHRIVPGFVVQGGDPEGTGQGGPGYSVTEAPPKSQKYTRGVVAMAKTELEEPGTSGSQFFIVTVPNAELDPFYAVAGKVSKGDDVVELLANVPNDPADNRPTEPVVIESVEIVSR